MAKRYVVRAGKIYARITYLNSAGKERQQWRRAQSKGEAKELARDLAHSIKQFVTEALVSTSVIGMRGCGRIDISDLIYT